MNAEWRTLARALTDSLVQDGTLADLAWRRAFEHTPRHVFVPDLCADDGTTSHAALDTVYQDETLVTKYASAPGTDIRWPISSSTMPSLMARMLELLDVVDGKSHVLEIGTGTGYNTALLCHRLGDIRVMSVDIDPDLVVDARRRLADIGYHPRLRAGDGAAGAPEFAPFDRILATCAVQEVPPAWIDQLTDDGVIVADIRGEIASTLVALRKTRAGDVVGRFQPVSGHFMWLRALPGNPLREGGAFSSFLDMDDVETRRTSVGVTELNSVDLRFVLQLFIPDAEGLFQIDRGDAPAAQLRTSDGSWAEVASAAGGHIVTTAGPRDIWDLVERAVEYWKRAGCPVRTRFGMTANSAGEQRVWLDSADSPVPSTDRT